MRKPFLFAISALNLLLLASCGLPSRGRPIAAYLAPKKALVVMDVQLDFVGPDARLPVEPARVEPMLAAIDRLTAEYVANGRPIVYIRNSFPKSDIGNLFRRGAAVAGSAGAEFDPRLKLASSTVFDKKVADAFSNKAFEQYLIDNQVDEIAVCGVFADQCVLLTSIAALNRKYKVTFVKGGSAAKTGANVERAAKILKRLGAEVAE